MRMLDFSSWNGVLTTLFGLVLVSLVMVGIRLVFMQTIQRRRERENRQINERLRTLIAAYKTLGGSFTGDLLVDPTHVRDLLRARQHEAELATEAGEITARSGNETIAERRRRTRDAVEAALSDIILLGTEEQVRLAVHAATEMVEGRPVEVKALVVLLRDFIRHPRRRRAGCDDADTLARATRASWFPVHCGGTASRASLPAQLRRRHRRGAGWPTRQLGDEEISV